MSEPGPVSPYLLSEMPCVDDVLLLDKCEQCAGQRFGRVTGLIPPSFDGDHQKMTIARMPTSCGDPGAEPGQCRWDAAIMAAHNTIR